MVRVISSLHAREFPKKITGVSNGSRNKVFRYTGIVRRIFTFLSHKYFEQNWLFMEKLGYMQ